MNGVTWGSGQIAPISEGRMRESKLAVDRWSVRGNAALLRKSGSFKLSLDTHLRGMRSSAAAYDAAYPTSKQARVFHGQGEVTGRTDSRDTLKGNTERSTLSGKAARMVSIGVRNPISSS